MHIGMYLNFAVNIFVTSAAISIFTQDNWFALLIALIITFVRCSICMTSIGTRSIRSQSNLRSPNEIEYERIEPIFRFVYQKAAAKSPSLPSDIKWFVHEDESLNAFAAGTHTIGLNMGLMIQCRDDEIAAVIAHEFAHIAHRDALATALSIQSNAVAGYAKKVLLLCVKIVGIGVTFLFSFSGGDKLFETVFSFVAKLAECFFNLYITFICMVCTSLSYASCRKQEYAADTYAAELGFSRPLIQFLKQLPTSSFSRKAEIAHILYGTHPKTEDRINRLQAYLQ